MFSSFSTVKSGQIIISSDDDHELIIELENQVRFS